MDTKEMIVWVVGLCLGAVILASPVACTMNRQHQISEAIKAGADPIAAKCAIEADVSHTPVCVLAAQKAKQQ